MRFKKGEWITRVWPGHDDVMRQGTVHQVESCEGMHLRLKGLQSAYDPNGFRLATAKEVSAATYISPTYTQADPTGKAQHEPGAKLDAGKLRPTLVLRDMARALWGVIKVATFGANKYTDGGWLEVPDGIKRYEEAAQRHRFAIAMGETHDPESKLPHRYHVVWNELAILELEERSKK